MEQLTPEQKVRLDKYLAAIKKACTDFGFDMVPTIVQERGYSERSGDYVQISASLNVAPIVDWKPPEVTPEVWPYPRNEDDK